MVEVRPIGPTARRRRAPSAAVIEDSVVSARAPPGAGSSAQAPLGPAIALPGVVTREDCSRLSRPVAVSGGAAAALVARQKVTPASIGLGAVVEAPRSRTVSEVSGVTPTGDGYPLSVAVAAPSVTISGAGRLAVAVGGAPSGRWPATVVLRPLHGATPRAARPSARGIGITHAGCGHLSTSK